MPERVGADIIREHGGALDLAIARFGGRAGDWLDLSTGINPQPYAVGDVADALWHRLPDAGGQARLLNAARAFWRVPDGAGIIAGAGVSALIALLPSIAVGLGNKKAQNKVRIDSPTYNEFAVAFKSAGWQVVSSEEDSAPESAVRIIVNPNNPDGTFTKLTAKEIKKYPLVVIDESFCDLTPEHSLIDLARFDNVIVLKGLGKFWGLGGLRLGFAAAPKPILNRFDALLGPWPISGPAQDIGARVLSDNKWAQDTRARLQKNTARLDEIATENGLSLAGGTDLFRLYTCADAGALYNHLAEHYIHTRVFSYSKNWIRLGFPPDCDNNWRKIQTALAAAKGIV